MPYYILEPGDVLDRLEAAYGQFNGRYFGGRLPTAVIRFEQPNVPDALGDCDWWGPCPRIRISPDLLTGRHPAVRGGPLNPVGLYRLCADVVLHESVHAHLAYVLGDRGMDEGGHHERFAAECRRIDALLGGRRKSAARVPITPANCGGWPENRRKPDGYYLGCLRRHGPPPALPAGAPAPVRSDRGAVLARARLVELGLA